MKTLPFLIFSILIFLSSYLLASLSPYPPISPLSASAHQITITAYVSEHLTYYKSNQGLIVSTNHQSGFVFLNEGDTKQFFQPTKQTFNLPGEFFLLIVNF